MPACANHTCRHYPGHWHYWEQGYKRVSTRSQRVQVVPSECISTTETSSLVEPALLGASHFCMRATWGNAVTTGNPFLGTHYLELVLEGVLGALNGVNDSCHCAYCVVCSVYCCCMRIHCHFSLLTPASRKRCVFVFHALRSSKSTAKCLQRLGAHEPNSIFVVFFCAHHHKNYLRTFSFSFSLPNSLRVGVAQIRGH